MFNFALGGGCFYIMMSYVLTILLCASTLFAAATGRSAQAGQAVLEGAQAAIEFSLSLAGGICLWSGISEVLERCGGARMLNRLLNLPLRLLFPRSARDEGCMAALSQNVSANILGLGNAATPAGIKAAKAMARLGEHEELCMLVLLNTASIQLIPSTIAAVRQASGAASAFDILPAVWFSSALSLAAGLLAAAVLKRLWP